MKVAPHHKSIVSAILIAFVLIVMAPASWADEKYPDRPLNMVVPFAPGGGADLGSKVMANRISEFLGQPLISVYKPGGGGSLGAAFVAKAKPNGYTLLVGANSVVVLPPIIKKLDYRLDDFVPTGMYGKIPIWVAVKADSKWKTLKDLIEAEKNSPGSIRVGSYGKLTPADFMIEALNKNAGVKMTHVPFKSSGEALTAMMGGHIEAAMVSGAGGFLETGQVRILAVADEQRLEGLPDVPTFREAGHPVSVSVVFSLWFPRGTPQGVVEKFAAAQEQAVRRYPREIKEALRKVEIWGEFLGPAETMKKFKKDHDVFLKMAQELGVLAK